MVPGPESNRVPKLMISSSYLWTEIKLTPRYTPTSELGDGTMPKGGIGLCENKLGAGVRGSNSFARHLYNDSDEAKIFLVAAVVGALRPHMLNYEHMNDWTYVAVSRFDWFTLMANLSQISQLPVIEF